MRRIALEVTRHSIRVLAIEGTPSKPRVRAFRIIPLTGPPSAEALRQAVAGLKPHRAELVSAIPRGWALTRLLKLPTTDPQELAQMVALASKAQLPFAPEQAVSDFHIVDQQGAGSTVQLTAYHRDQVTQHLDLLRQARCAPHVIIPSTWGLLGWYQRLAKTQSIREPVLVINVDVDRTDLALIRHDRLLFSRSLDQGLHGVHEALPLGVPELDDFHIGLVEQLENFVVFGAGKPALFGGRRHRGVQHRGS